MLAQLVAVVSLSLLFSANDVYGLHCDGCSNNPATCVELVDDTIYGCYGAWSSGPISDSALNLCKRGQGYHMCESANEAEVFGLTIGDCQNKVPAGHHFWSLESSVDYVTPEGQCYSKNGPVTYNDRPRDDVWGCLSSQTDISNCGSVHNQACGPFNKACTAQSSGGVWEEDGVWMCPCEGIELFTMAVTNGNVGGVVCCPDNIPTDLGSGCDESITVWRINPGFIVPTPNFAPFVGKYRYYGNDNDGYPRYVHESGAEITVSIFFAKYTITVKLPGYDFLYSSAQTFEEGGVVINAGNNRWEISESFFSPPGTSMNPSTTNNDQIPLINPDYQFDSTNPIENFQMIATFSDCPWYGLEIVSDSTPVPTPARNPNECPDYDHTVYSNCNGDVHCSNCQPWGCAQCENGYYKMGNLKRCQSCNSNYPNCQQCGDWNGCTSCNQPFQLQWNSQCNDEICQ